MNSQGGTRRRERLSARQRLHDPTDFQAVYAARDAVRSGSLVVCFMANGMKHSRLGVSVSRKYGNAVRRNRIKRVFRAAFRQCQHELPPGFDYVFLPRHGVAEYATVAVVSELRNMLPKLATAAAGKAGKAASAGRAGALKAGRATAGAVASEERPR